MLEFRKVNAWPEQETLANLAAEIWNEYWPPRIGQPQTEYMLKRFQSIDAIREDMAHKGYEYWLIYDGERLVGYTGGCVEPETSRFFISKVYLRDSERGKGFARKAIEFYNQVCLDRGLRAMYLTVNKHNDVGIRAYKGTGFDVIDAVEKDIGDGFVMDDYIMERKAAAAQ